MPETVTVLLENFEISRHDGGGPPAVGAVKLTEVHPILERVYNYFELLDGPSSVAVYFLAV